jgi:putative pyruvate formate lyase activating enzyme
VDRLANKIAACKTGRYARVSSYFEHFGEEDCLRGWNGSGTIFFSWCNLRCQFCQNFDISQIGHGAETRPERLAHMMLELQAAGCHNINFVTPEHVVPQILEALAFAVEGGLRLPIVYNTSAYDSLESLHQMDGVVDVYMPDFKVWDSRMALKYLLAKDYPEAARRAIKEMHRQVGELKMDERGLAKRGVLVRHLVMPGAVAGTREIMRFLAREVSPHTYVNVMAQYYPAGKVSNEKYPEINRPITSQEYASALSAARDAGLHRFDERHSLWPRV